MGKKIDKEIIRKAIKHYSTNNVSIVESANIFNIGATTLTRYLQKENIDTSSFKNIKYNYNRDYFEYIDTEEKAYWLGFIAADGSIVSKDSVVEVTLLLKDKEHLYKLVNAIDGENEMIKNKDVYVNDTLYKATKLSICSQKMVKDFMTHIETLGISKIKMQKKGPVYSWNKCGINQISIILEYLYKDCNVYLDRKHIYANKICRLELNSQKT